MSDPDEHGEGESEGESYVCESCGHTGDDFIEEENPDERTWGALGDYFLICPECQSIQMG